jgi:hypothetical protein
LFDTSNFISAFTSRKKTINEVDSHRTLWLLQP